MKRRVFYSFHYQPDAWRAAQVRNSGVVDGNVPIDGNAWEDVKQGGDAAIKRWIDQQISSRDVTIVLVGAETAQRRWVLYEITKSWNERKGVVGIHIHNLKNSLGHQATKGANPLAKVVVGGSQIPLSSVAKCYDPPYASSDLAYAHIKENLGTWVDEALRIRRAQ